MVMRMNWNDEPQSIALLRKTLRYFSPQLEHEANQFQMRVGATFGLTQSKVAPS
jgi:hypothetical protein